MAPARDVCRARWFRCPIRSLPVSRRHRSRLARAPARLDSIWWRRAGVSPSAAEKRRARGACVARPLLRKRRAAPEEASGPIPDALSARAALRRHARFSRPFQARGGEARRRGRRLLRLPLHRATGATVTAKATTAGGSRLTILVAGMIAADVGYGGA